MTIGPTQRFTARMLLVTFPWCFVACGGSQSQAPTTTTTTVTVTTTSAAPTTTEAPTTTTQPAPPPTLPAQPPQSLNKDELRDLVAPVALYPDVVLASLLPATTFPNQIHDAAAYVGAAQHVDRVPEDRGWDGSVIGLLQFPDVLRWLDANPAWTDQMGQAVTYQQGDVLAAIQDYRRTVRDVGNLKSNQYQTVRSEPSGDVRIEPARKDVVYVPSYDPAAATQPQPASSGGGINPWLAFGGGAVVGALGAWALYSIFDDDDHDHGGSKHIKKYNNYYYSGSRRPQQVDWAPQQRPNRGYAGGVQRPHRMEHRAPAGKSARAAALRPPTTQASPLQAQPTRREQRQERKQQRQAQQQEQRQQQRQRSEQRQQQQREQRDQRQEQQRQQRQQRQEQQGQQREQRQQRQDAEQQQRRERKAERQQQRRDQQEQRQERRQQNGGQKKKKKGGDGQ